MIPQVMPAEVGDRFLLDVRTQEEWDVVRAPGATLIPMHELLARIDEVPQRLAVICHVGGRSAQVTQYLLEQGYDAVNVVGGMDHWQAFGLPVESGHGAHRSS